MSQPPATVRSLSDLGTSRRNHFGTLRLCAALLVLFSHSFGITGHPGEEPVARVLRFFDGGAVALMVFFATSGFLVSKSLEGKGAVAYLEARVLRIFPALFVAACVTAFIIGLLGTGARGLDYLMAIETREYPLCTMVFLESCGLPRVFMSTPLAGGVNGSLWTLPLEVFMYLVLLAAALFPPRRQRVALTVLALLGYAAYALAPELTKALIPKGSADVTGPVVGAFILGALAYRYRASLPLSAPLAVALAGATWLLFYTAVGTFLLIACIAYSTLCLAGVQAGSSSAPARDLSFGVYLYAFPIQQLLEERTGVQSPYVLCGLAAPVVLLLAAASWSWIEAPALKLKGRLLSPRFYRRADRTVEAPATASGVIERAD